MTKFLIALCTVCVAFGSAAAGDCDLPAWPCYEIGMPVPILFEQEEEVEGWDGAIAWGATAGKRRLQVSNCCFLVVTRGLGRFDRSAGDNRVDIHGWQGNEPPRGVLVPTTAQGPEHVQHSFRLPGPFSTLADLSEIYDLRRPGVYTVYWGHNCASGLQCEAEIMFEILPKGALKRAADLVNELLGGDS